MKLKSFFLRWTSFLMVGVFFTTSGTGAFQLNFQAGKETRQQYLAAHSIFFKNPSAPLKIRHSNIRLTSKLAKAAAAILLTLIAACNTTYGKWHQKDWENIAGEINRPTYRMNHGKGGTVAGFLMKYGVAAATAPFKLSDESTGAHAALLILLLLHEPLSAVYFILGLSGAEVEIIYQTIFGDSIEEPEYQKENEPSIDLPFSAADPESSENLLKLEKEILLEKNLVAKLDSIEELYSLERGKNLLPSVLLKELERHKDIFSEFQSRWKKLPSDKSVGVNARFDAFEDLKQLYPEKYQECIFLVQVLETMNELESPEFKLFNNFWRLFEKDLDIYDYEVVLYGSFLINNLKYTDGRSAEISLQLLEKIFEKHSKYVLITLERCNAESLAVLAQNKLVKTSDKFPVLNKISEKCPSEPQPSLIQDRDQFKAGLKKQEKGLLTGLMAKSSKNSEKIVQSILMQLMESDSLSRFGLKLTATEGGEVFLELDDLAGNSVRLFPVSKENKFAPAFMQFWNDSGVSDAIEYILKGKGNAEEICERMSPEGRQFLLALFYYDDPHQMKKDGPLKRKWAIINKLFVRDPLTAIKYVVKMQERYEDKEFSYMRDLYFDESEEVKGFFASETLQDKIPLILKESEGKDLKPLKKWFAVPELQDIVLMVFLVHGDETDKKAAISEYGKKINLVKEHTDRISEKCARIIMEYVKAAGKEEKLYSFLIDRCKKKQDNRLVYELLMYYPHKAEEYVPYLFHKTGGFAFAYPSELMEKVGSPALDYIVHRGTWYEYNGESPGVECIYTVGKISSTLPPKHPLREKAWTFVKKFGWPKNMPLALYVGVLMNIRTPESIKEARRMVEENKDNFPSLLEEIEKIERELKETSSRMDVNPHPEFDYAS